MAESSEHSGNKGVIPYFFYDVIAFIIPGSLLIIGGFWIWFGADWSSALYSWLLTPDRKEGSIAAMSVIFGIVFLLFLGVAAATGYFLSALSHLLLDRVWRRMWPYNLDRLSRFMGVDKCSERLRNAYKDKFGSELMNGMDIEKASALCTLYVWSRSAALGAMISRTDAEKIMCQSLIFANLLLLSECIVRGSSIFLIFGLAICGFASFTGFKYIRSKRVYGRFEAFLVLSGDGRNDRTESD